MAQRIFCSSTMKEGAAFGAAFFTDGTLVTEASPGLPLPPVPVYPYRSSGGVFDRFSKSVLGRWAELFFLDSLNFLEPMADGQFNFAHGPLGERFVFARQSPIADTTLVLILRGITDTAVSSAMPEVLSTDSIAATLKFRGHEDIGFVGASPEQLKFAMDFVAIRQRTFSLFLFEPTSVLYAATDSPADIILSLAAPNVSFSLTFDFKR